VAGGGRATVVGTFLAIIGLVFAMNWFGLRVSGRVQLVLTAVLAVLLLVTVLTALPHARWANLTPFAPHGPAGIGAAAAVLVWGFAGWEAVSSLAADYRNPRRDVPRAAAVAVVVVGALYLAVAATSVLVLGPALAGSPAPLADLLAVGVGGPVRGATAVVAVLLTIGAMNAYLAGASRLGAALARDGALPRRPFGTPRRSLTFVLLASLASVALPLRLQTSMLLVTGCFTLVYILGTAAAIRLLPRPLPAIIAFASTLGLLVLTGPPALLSLVIAAGAVGYASRRRAKTASPSSISDGSTAPNPNTKPACEVA
jgi:amino acid efflux transporter